MLIHLVVLARYEVETKCDLVSNRASEKLWMFEIYQYVLLNCYSQKVTFFCLTFIGCSHFCPRFPTHLFHHTNA